MVGNTQEENLNLRLQLKVGDEAEDAENIEILEIKKSLHDLVSRGVDEGEILQTMDLLTERFADYGRYDRQDLVLCLFRSRTSIAWFRETKSLLLGLEVLLSACVLWDNTVRFLRKCCGVRFCLRGVHLLFSRRRRRR